MGGGGWGGREGLKSPQLLHEGRFHLVHVAALQSVATEKQNRNRNRMKLGTCGGAA